MTSLSKAAVDRITLALAAGAALWAALVVYTAGAGLLAQLYMPLIAVLVAGTIILPTVVFLHSRTLRGYVDAVGLFPITALHVWRIPAALLFFWFGARGELPPAFWLLAGVGDFIAGSLAATVFFRRPGARVYALIHRFGFADFVVAVGTGLTYTLLQDPRMGPVAELPLALVPLFGVGISGATHLVAFDYLRRHRGRGAPIDRPLEELATTTQDPPSRAPRR